MAFNTKEVDSLIDINTTLQTNQLSVLSEPTYNIDSLYNNIYYSTIFMSIQNGPAQDYSIGEFNDGNVTITTNSNNKNNVGIQVFNVTGAGGGEYYMYGRFLIPLCINSFLLTFSLNHQATNVGGNENLTAEVGIKHYTEDMTTTTDSRIFIFDYSTQTISINSTQQTSWNIDTVDGTGSSGYSLTSGPTNSYAIEWGGPHRYIKYYVSNNETGKWILVHRVYDQFATYKGFRLYFRCSQPAVTDTANTVLRLNDMQIKLKNSINFACSQNFSYNISTNLSSIDTTGKYIVAFRYSDYDEMNGYNIINMLNIGILTTTNDSYIIEISHHDNLLDDITAPPSSNIVSSLEFYDNPTISPSGNVIYREVVGSNPSGFIDLSKIRIDNIMNVDFDLETTNPTERIRSGISIFIRASTVINLEIQEFIFNWQEL